MKIGELARRGGTTAKTIRFYEQAGLLPAPARTQAGYRDYGPESIDRLEFVGRAQSAGLSLREVRQVLAIADRGDAPCEHVVSTLQARLDQVRATIAELSSLEAHLGALLDHATTAGPIEEAGVCWILESDLADPGTAARAAVEV
ncbi:heavy metal-responsive transcriptional regulator [Mycobacterium sp. AZCC_0083]|uniref:heavy metal-responsive transcriptional regulator n=1 Tax=Mycobacterium sp. AZCC_0083 TaxID=2735882 RepID=UPI00161F020B|nr:heavy metal-responsive transcriptional regulator [Mycobacterium sp. AZCC_0083]MBB5161741.1 DNA-binding transcriptional MerR regulator [Mycobacterium sp. AZCC_0083]